MKLMRLILLILLAAFVSVSLGLSKMEYAKKESKACTYCHPHGNMKALTEAGEYYKKNNHSLKGYTPAPQAEKN